MVLGVSGIQTQDDLLGSSATGESLLALGSAIGTSACAQSALYIADATTPGSMATYTKSIISSIPSLTPFLQKEQTMTLSADGLTIVGVVSKNRFAQTSRSKIGAVDFGTPSETLFATIHGTLPAGAKVTWPVLSPDGLAFYFVVTGSTNASNDGIYESVRAASTDVFPAGVKLGGVVQTYEAIMSVSPDRLTAFASKNFGTVILTRSALGQDFSEPGGTVPPGNGWRIIPILGCTKLIGTCEPGGCAGEDICVWNQS
jgi:hypothetical protein